MLLLVRRKCIGSKESKEKINIGTSLEKILGLKIGINLYRILLEDLENCLSIIIAIKH